MAALMNPVEAVGRECFARGKFGHGESAEGVKGGDAGRSPSACRLGQPNRMMHKAVASGEHSRAGPSTEGHWQMAQQARHSRVRRTDPSRIFCNIHDSILATGLSLCLPCQKKKKREKKFIIFSKHKQEVLQALIIQPSHSTSLFGLAT